MNPHDLTSTDPTSLAQLLDPEATERREWRADELGAILRHQLAAPLGFDLEAVAPDARQTLASAATTVAQPPHTFGELFAHPQPPLALLELARQFGKTQRQSTEHLLPAEIATVVYYASIVAARLRCQERISQISDDALGRGLDWALAQPWLEEPLRALFAAGRQQLAGKG